MTEADAADAATDGSDADGGAPADAPATERSTAPQSAYTNRDVVVGFVVAAIGLVVTVGLPLLVV